MLASRLSEDPNRSVLLLEAGQDYADPDQLRELVRIGHSAEGEAIGSAVSWNLRGVINDQQGEINIAQGKVIGGSGSINGQVYLRGLPEDFVRWESHFGNQEWGYLKVLPYYRRAETDLDIQDDFHGSEGPIPIVRREDEEWPAVQKAFYDACMERGYPSNPRPQRTRLRQHRRHPHEQPQRLAHEHQRHPPHARPPPPQSHHTRQRVRAPRGYRGRQGHRRRGG